MKNKLGYLLMVLLVLAACRTDHLQEEKARNEASESLLRSKIISLNESVHKNKISPLLSRLKQSYKNNKTGKNVSFGDSISINTDHVIFIENGPNYHTYTFNIKRNNPLPGNPVENLLLTPLPDGTYKEFLVTYNFTQQEKDQLLLGNSFNYLDKADIKPLENSNFLSGLLARTVCSYDTIGIFTTCSDGVHSNGEPKGSGPGECRATTPSVLIMNIQAQDCWETGSPGTGGSPNPGEGGDNGGDGGTVPCSEGSFLEPTDPETAASGCNTGVPTLPNLEDDRTPCAKTKAMLAKIQVQHKIQELKIQSTITGDSAKEIGFKISVDGTPSAIIQGGKANVKLNPSVGDLSGYHNHPPDAIKIHSTEDIIGVMSFAINNPDKYKDSFLGMIGSTICSTCEGGYYYYHYLIRYTGSYAEIHTLLNLTNWDHETLGITYRRRQRELRTTPAYTDNQLETINNKGLEKLFFETLKNMGLENKISLQRVDDNGTTQIVNNITLDENNEPMAIPCP